MKGLSARDTYRDELTTLGEKHPEIVCLEMDLGGKDHPFQKKCPKRFFNMGIAEMATIDIAASLANSNLIPFVSTFSSFAVLRSIESIKLNMGYMKKNIKIIAPYAGCSGGWFGQTHQCLEDFAMLQPLPGIVIAAPYGERETREVIRSAYNSPSPFYIRMGRNQKYKSLSIDSYVLPGLYLDDDFSDHKTCLISIGEEPTRIVLELKKTYSDIAHAHITYVNERNLKSCLPYLDSSFQNLIVIEEHRKMGGIGSSISLLAKKSKVHSFCLNNNWLSYGGSHMQQLNHYGLTCLSLVEYLKSCGLLGDSYE